VALAMTVAETVARNLSLTSCQSNLAIGDITRMHKNPHCGGRGGRRGSLWPLCYL